MVEGAQNLLHVVEIFKDLDAEKTNAIGQRCNWIRLPKGKLILSEHEPSTDVFLIVEGRVAAKSYSDQGKEITYTELARGELFGEFSAIDKQPRSASVQTLEESYVGSMSSDSFRDLIANDPELAIRFAEHMVRKNRELTQKVYEFSTMTIRHRLCAEILRMAGGDDVGDSEAFIEPAPTQYHLATKLGTHREAVNREIAALSSRGIIEFTRKRVTILQPDTLRRIIES